MSVNPEFPSSRRPAAFSVIELIVVMAVAILLMALLIPAINGIVGGTNINSVSEEVASAFSLARQRASTFNRQVAIRFYYDDKVDGFTSFQLFEKPESTSDPDVEASWKAVNAEQKLPQGVKIQKDSDHSPLLLRNDFSDKKEQKPRGEVTYSEVLLTPAGAVVAETEDAILTIVPATGSAEGTIPGLPTNFATLVIEPFNARPTIYRP